MIHGTRVRNLNNEPTRGEGTYVLYWMQRAQRAHGNHALEHAVRLANDHGLPLLAAFALTPTFPGGNRRSYAFMLDGLRQTAHQLQERGIPLLLRPGDPPEIIASLASGAALVVTDRGYLRQQRAWRRELAEGLGCPVIQVETDAVVPADTTTQKQEYAARTIRPRIHKHLADYMTPLEETSLQRDGLDHPLAQDPSLPETSTLLDDLDLPRQPGPVSRWRAGTEAARSLLEDFCQGGLPRYDKESNEPGLEISSQLSPYLHFGQISPLEVALRVQRHQREHPDDVEAFLEQLIVRRELAINMCLHHPDYASIACLPDWARGTLEDHAGDKRPVTYTPQQLEAGETDDPYWNAAQREMLLTGKMHGYMRMYWGKKILEWTPDPQTGYDLALTLNDRYELDGRDPNGYAGVAWCYGKHDQAWKERPIYGKVRYMNANGLERKFDMDAYLARVEGLANDAQEETP